jgi:hypothetical protein
MTDQKQGQCEDCRDSVETTAKAYVYCSVIRKQILREQVMPCFICDRCKRGAEQ